MKASDALAQLAEFALAGAAKEDQLYVYDAIAMLPVERKHIAPAEARKLSEIQRNAKRIAASIRNNDAAQLQFRALLNIGGSRE